MSGRSTAARVAIAVPVVWALFVGLLVVAEAVPDGPIERRLAAAVEAGEYGPDLVPDRFGGFHDGFTECVVLGQGLGSPPEPMGLWHRTVFAPRIGSCDDGADQIRTLAAGGQVEAGPYDRYWNGYAPLTRPVLAIAGVVGLRVVVGALLLAACGFAAVAVGRRLGWMVTVALFAPLVASSNLLTTPLHGFTHAFSLAVIALGTGAVAVAAGRGGWPAAAAASALAAALFVYVDLLTTPAIPWALAAFVAAAVVAAGGAPRRQVVRTLAAVGLAWPVAYAATWVARWLLAAAVLGPDVLDRVAEVSRFRVGGEFSGVQEHLGAATRVNLTWWLGRVPTAGVVLGLAAVVSLIAVGILLRHDRSRLPVAVLLASPALLVPAWYEALANHAQIHAFFTYRSVPVAVGITAAACLLAARPAPTPATPLRPPPTAGHG